MDSEQTWECSLWSNQQNGMEESFVVSGNTSACSVGKNMDLIPPEDALAAELCLINGAHNLNPLINDLMGDFGNVSTVSRSFDSIDCLLSDTNSNADVTASVEDDGISMIFLADYESSWNFGASRASGSVVSSSGEPRNSCNNKRTINIVTNKELQCWPDESDQNLGHDHDKVAAKRPKAGAGPGYSYFDLDSCKNPREPKKPRTSTNINFQHPGSSVSSSLLEEPDTETAAQMKEMIYRAAAFRPVNLGLEVVDKPRRRNVKISSDPQTVAARQRRERIGQKIRVLQKLVPGGSKMDTASMLDEAANYLKFLRSQVNAFENLSHKLNSTSFTFSSSSFPLCNIHSCPLEAYLSTNLKP